MRERRSLLEPQNKGQNKRMTGVWKPSHPGAWVTDRWQVQEHWVWEEWAWQAAGGMSAHPCSSPAFLVHVAMLGKNHLPWGKWQGLCYISTGCVTQGSHRAPQGVSRSHSIRRKVSYIQDIIMLVGWANSSSPLFRLFQGPLSQNYLTQPWLGWPRHQLAKVILPEASQLSSQFSFQSRHWPIWLCSQPSKWRPGPRQPGKAKLGKAGRAHGNLGRYRKTASGESTGCLFTEPPSSPLTMELPCPTFPHRRKFGVPPYNPPAQTLCHTHHGN